MCNIYISEQEGKDMMEYELTPEMFKKFGKGFEDAFLAYLPIEKRLKGLTPEELLAGLTPEELLAGLTPEEILASLTPEELLGCLPYDDILAYINKGGKKVKAARDKGKGKG